MSYTLAFYTVPVDELTAGLTAQDASSDPEIAAAKAVGLLRELGEPVDIVTHGSAGGTWFRDHFITEVLGGLIGAETAGYLVERPLAGVDWSGHPSMGWLTRDELAAAVRALDEAGEDSPGHPGEPESEEVLELVDDILHMAGMAGQDLVTVYA